MFLKVVIVVDEEHPVKDLEEIAQMRSIAK